MTEDGKEMRGKAKKDKKGVTAGKKMSRKRDGNYDSA